MALITGLFFKRTVFFDTVFRARDAVELLESGASEISQKIAGALHPYTAACLQASGGQG